MSEKEEFLKRWSRRKQEAEAEAKKDVLAEPKPETEVKLPNGEAGKSGPSVATEKDLQAFDPKSLPSLDSITATTDIRCFLAPGVPEQLKYAALRQMWKADPDIRDFIGLVENGWDFNDPNNGHGFGSFEVTEELKRAVERMFDRSLAPKEAKREIEKEIEKEEPQAESEGQFQVVAPKGTDETKDRISEIDRVEDSANLRFAMQQKRNKDEKDNDRSSRRDHGSALPK